ncbi:hypothetical protein OOU_Y34scaffold00986g1 [Pyricularia oryzae Y34]|uniref:Uncharacterized protein n=2 Tax=Pyricularia oryzae TaxID=318829 RepID=A0AA97PG09_PYRO3|nr:hypothetical protein OOU_Y34scaffold00986g1 [Pyricularia oryzae Y34]
MFRSFPKGRRGECIRRKTQETPDYGVGSKPS